MPQSLTRNYVHILFSTKNREPFLVSTVKEELDGYLGGIGKKMDCFPISIGGYTDHVHLLCLLSKNIALCKLVEVIKSYSSTEGSMRLGRNGTPAREISAEE